MKVTICGSMHHIEGMKQAEQLLTAAGYEVETPNPREGEVDYHSLSDEERATLKDTLIKEHLDKIKQSDAILVYNEDKKGVAGYIGGNTLMEMAFAYSQGIEIFLFRPAPDMSYTDEILGMQPIILNGEVMKIDEYFTSLPMTLVSSKSPLKLLAVSRGMRRAGIHTNVQSYPTASGVAEQPRTIEETYEGALNRHKTLKKESADKNPSYLATLEGGNHPLHPQHNVFSSTVAVIEKVGGEMKVGMNVELELPKAMTDKIPSVYPDLGILAQQEYGSRYKDPFPYFTGGKITRLDLIENAVFSVAVQLAGEQDAAK